MKMFTVIGILLTVVASASAADVELTGRRSRTLEMQSFQVDRASDVDLSAVGIRQKFSDELFASAWIVGADGRVVWSLENADWQPAEGHRYLVSVEQSLRLPAGAYVAYLFPGGSWWNAAMPFKDLGRVFNDLADFLRSDDPGKKPDWYATRCLLRLSDAAGGIRLLEEPPALQAQIVLAPVGDNELREALMRITRPTRLRISACGERDRGDGGLWDLGWIENAVTGEPLWTMNVTRCTAAGGAAKNVHWSGEVPVEPGDYRVSFVTDSSHAWGGWNDRPPADPRLWGLLVDAMDHDALVLIDGDDLVADPDVLVRWLRLGDNVDLHEDLVFDHPVRLKIDGIGEGERRSMFDGGSITDLASGRVVWAMAWENTEPAGGGDKNRQFDGIVSLPAGSYRLSYSSDGSHAFGSWNTSPPREPYRYGMVVRVLE